MVTRSISLLVDALAQQPRGENSLSLFGERDHVILCGPVKWHVLLHFVKEFYSIRQNHYTKVVVLVANAKWSDLQWHRYVPTCEHPLPPPPPSPKTELLPMELCVCLCVEKNCLLNHHVSVCFGASNQQRSGEERTVPDTSGLH